MTTILLIGILILLFISGFSLTLLQGALKKIKIFENLISGFDDEIDKYKRRISDLEDERNRFRDMCDSYWLIIKNSNVWNHKCNNENENTKPDTPVENDGDVEITFVTTEE